MIEPTFGSFGASLTSPSAGTEAGAMKVIAEWAAEPDRAVIFDFNGTLSDDEGLLLRLYTSLFEDRLGWTLTPDVYRQRYTGTSDREIIEGVVEEVGGAEDLVLQLLAERHTRYCQMVQDRSPILARTTDAVRLLASANIHMGIVTGAQRVDVDFVLSSSALAGLFQVVVTEEDVHSGKPDPEGFLRAAKAMGHTAASILVFEDSPPGVRSAKAAGMRCIAVAGTVPPSALTEADAVISVIAPELFIALSPAGAGQRHS